MIQVKNLSAGYNGKMIVKEISLDIQPGEVLVIVGPNGSGKSTFLKALLGFLETTEGQVLYEGQEISTMTQKQIARKAAFLTQSRNTPSITARRMVLHGRFPYLSYPRQYSKEDDRIAKEAMAATGSLAYADKLVAELSGGERQRVYLAMALAQQTEYIFMDEPTTYLDINRQLQMLEMAKEMAENGKAVVLVLHDLAQALALADRIVVMENGTLRCVDQPDHIYESGVLNQVFGVEVHRIETPHGMQYYCTVKKEDV